MKPKIKRVTSTSELIQGLLENEYNMKINQAKVIGEQQLEREKHRKEMENIYSIKESFEISNNNYYEFSNDVKKVLLSECINKIFDKALELNEYCDITNNYNYINNFINEKGVNVLLREFKTKTPMLSEFSRLVSKYHSIIMEKVEKDKPETYKIDDEDKDSFFDEIDNKEVDRVSQIIHDRVKNAIDQFMEDNAKDKEKIKEIISKAQDKVESIKDEKVAESYINKSNYKIKNIKNNRNQTILEYMVSSISKNTIKDETLREEFIIDGKLDMDRIVESAIVMYTFLETVNTAKLDNVNLRYIESVYEQLKG